MRAEQPWRLVMRRGRGGWLAAIGMLLGAVAPAVAVPVATLEARADFIAAERALAAGQTATYKGLIERLRDYPLYPYLRVEELMTDAGPLPDPRIEALLEVEAETAPSQRLRAFYLRRLAAAGRWADYVHLARPSADPASQCAYRHALSRLGRQDEALDGFASLWLNGRSLPGACDPLLAAWRATGALTQALVWARVRLALELDDTRLARYLGRDLEPDERLWLERWLAVREDPRLIEAAPEWPEHEVSAAIVADGLARWSAQAPEQARDWFLRFGALLATDAAAADMAHAALGRALARAGEDSAWTLWDGLRALPDTLTQQELRLRMAVRAEAWNWVMRWIEAMPDTDVKRERWIYWQARAAEALGQHARAAELFQDAAMARSLWGFLAADRLGQPYALAHAPIAVDAARQAAWERHPAVSRMRELEALGRLPDLRREWRVLTAALEDDELLAAARVASLAGWHDLAIPAVARARHWDDLDLRFPLAHRVMVEEQAQVHGLDAGWILAVMRQESLFTVDVASSADALGLMQLLPSTAREVARRLGQPEPSRQELLSPERNIALGTAYLVRLRERFGHPALVTAAYNAGQGRVAGWLPEGGMDADRWILAIPFRETRDYVERVLAYWAIYDDRLGQPRQRLSARLPPLAVDGVR